MSSILDALEKLERPTPRSAGLPPPPARRGGRAVLLAGLAGAGLTAAVAAAWLSLRAPAPPPSIAAGTPAERQPAAPPDTSPAPAAAVPATVPSPTGALAAASRGATPPAPAMATARPSADAPAAASARTDSGVKVAPGLADPLRVARPVPAPAADAGRRPLALPVGPTFESATDVAASDPVTPPTPTNAGERATEPPSHVSSRPPAVPDLGRPPAGAPEVRVAFLLYSAHADRRSVAVQLDGGPLTTLREGEDAHDVRVVRIMPDRVELDWQGERFAVAARD